MRVYKNEQIFPGKIWFIDTKDDFEVHLPMSIFSTFYGGNYRDVIACPKCGCATTKQRVKTYGACSVCTPTPMVKCPTCGRQESTGNLARMGGMCSVCYFKKTGIGVNVPGVTHPLAVACATCGQGFSPGQLNTKGDCKTCEAKGMITTCPACNGHCSQYEVNTQGFCNNCFNLAMQQAASPQQQQLNALANSQQSHLFNAFAHVQQAAMQRAAAAAQNIFQQGVQASHQDNDLQPPASQTYFEHGKYKVVYIRDRGHYHLTFLEDARLGSDILTTWEECPRRSDVAREIKKHRWSLPRINARDEFGSLLGIRYMNTNEEGILCSPSFFTEWETNVLVAENWDESGGVRGVAGIHAAWPQRDRRGYPKIDSSKSTYTVYAEVRGFGKFVAGDKGWRAEKVIIDTVYLTPLTEGFQAKLEARYPQITFEPEAPWISERLSRSVRPRRKKSL